MRRGRPRKDGLDDLLPGAAFVREQIRTLANRAAKPITSERDADFAARYRSGQTLAEIGAFYGLTRERVRQCLAKQGLTAIDGGRSLCAAIEAKSRARRKQQKIERRSRELFGVSTSELLRIGGTDRPTGRYNDHRYPVLRAYLDQRRNAARLGIEWALSLSEWAAIWDQSGKWAERGRGNGYCLARRGNCGPFAAWNVRVCSNAVNASESYTRTPAAVRTEKARMTRAMKMSHLRSSAKNEAANQPTDRNVS
jgi:hypothetical protein